MMYIYLTIIFFVLVLVILNLLSEKSIPKQLNAAMVIIPLLLRLLMIK